jgi:hypothetical protein
MQVTYFISDILSHLFALFFHFAMFVFSTIFSLTNGFLAFSLFLLCLLLIGQAIITKSCENKAIKKFNVGSYTS